MEAELRRLFGFLESVRAIHMGRACYTPEGCAYLGVPFQFPEQSVIDYIPEQIWNVEKLKQRIYRTLNEASSEASA